MIDLYAPGSVEYAAGTSPHNNSGEQQPAYVAHPLGADDVVDVVREAARRGLTLVSQASGHGAGGSIGENSIIVDTSGLDGVSIDVDARLARVGAGATWASVNGAAQRHGLLGLAGSSPDVTVSGYTFGGGVGWLTRRHGLASASLRTVLFVDGAGRLRRATDDAADQADRDAIWAYRGGGGIGIAVELEFDLAPSSGLWAGYLLWSIDHLDAVVEAWAETRAASGTAVSTSLSVLHAPPGPPFPDQLRGQPVVHLAIASLDGPESATPLRHALARIPAPTVDTWASADATVLAGIHLDPPAAVPALGVARWLNDSAPRVMLDAMTIVAAEDSPVTMIEFRDVAAAASAGPTDVRAGALTVPAPFLVHAVGMAADGEAGLEDAFRAILDALAPADIGRSVASFAEGRIAVPDALDAADIARVRSIRDVLDPHHLFADTRITREGSAGGA